MGHGCLLNCFSTFFFTVTYLLRYFVILECEFKFSWVHFWEYQGLFSGYIPSGKICISFCLVYKNSTNPRSISFTLMLLLRYLRPILWYNILEDSIQAWGNTFSEDAFSDRENKSPFVYEWGFIQYSLFLNVYPFKCSWLYEKSLSQFPKLWGSRAYLLTPSSHETQSSKFLILACTLSHCDLSDWLLFYR